MSYKVLSRKYRPKTFNEVVGQDNALTILRSFIETESIPHALIFCGSRGVGKTSMARIFAKTINCNELQENKVCDECSICNEIDENKSLDVIEIDAASNNGVDQIREIIESSNYSSINCKYKVFIIDEVHMLSKAAFNALLKTLEEPNKNTVFILATTEVEKIPPTILSRCQMISFKTLDKTSLITNLKNICGSEKISIDEDSLSLIAEESRGSVRDSLGILEQLMTSLNKSVDISETRQILGATSDQILFEISKNLLESNIKGCLTNYDSIYKNGFDSKKFVHSLLNYIRSAIYYKLKIQNEIEDLMRIEESQISELEKYDLELLENLFDQLIKLYEMCGKTQNIKFLIESSLIKLCLISNYLNFDEIIKEESISDKTSSHKDSGTYDNESDSKIKKTIEPIKKKSPKSQIIEFNELNFIEELKNSNNENYKLLKNCDVKIEGNNITIDTKNELIYKILNERDKLISIENITDKMFNVVSKVSVINSKESNKIEGSDDFKFTEKKDRLFESETMKNLFNTFDCRVLNIEKDE
jgi:DNA polymerase-3 subunit gamma/tau